VRVEVRAQVEAQAQIEVRAQIEARITLKKVLKILAEKIKESGENILIILHY